MEQATTSHAADTASNSMTRGVKSGLCALLPFVIVVGGCSGGPKYKAPTTPMRPFHNPAPMRADRASAPPLDTWWEAAAGLSEEWFLLSIFRLMLCQVGV